MSVRKPAGEPWESFVDRQVREAQERGEFDQLHGAGRPIADLHQPYDELWWVRRKLKDEKLTYIPPALQLRKDVETAREGIGRARSEREVRSIVGQVNAHIRVANRTVLQGPSSVVSPLDEEDAVDGWRQRHGGGQP